MNTKEELLELIEAIKKEEITEYQEENLKSILFNCDIEELKELIDSVYSIDLAMMLEDFTDEEIVTFFDKIELDVHVAQILEQASDRLQDRIVDLLSQEKVLNIFNFMSTDDIADILGHLRTNHRKELLNLMRTGDNKHVEKLLQYDDDTAGGIMTTEYISLRYDLKLINAWSKIKEIAPKTEVIETIFVVDEKNNLIGTADLRDILVAGNDETLNDIMSDNIVTVTPNIDQEEVSILVSKYDLKVIPVVNRKGAMLGIITVDDIIDVLMEEQTEDMLKFGGVAGEEGIYSSVISSVKVRLPWLLVNLVTASLSAIIISSFESTIEQVVALSAIMPIVAATSGNAGSQTLAITIRGITLGEISLKKDWNRVFKEMGVGLLNSCFTASIAGVVVYIMYDNIYLSGIISIAMMVNSLISSSCGFFIPLTLKALKLDPALASSIFLTATTDIMAYLIFLLLASSTLNYLI